MSDGSMAISSSTPANSKVIRRTDSSIKNQSSSQSNSQPKSPEDSCGVGCFSVPGKYCQVGGSLSKLDLLIGCLLLSQRPNWDVSGETFSFVLEANYC